MLLVITIGEAGRGEQRKKHWHWDFRECWLEKPVLRWQTGWELRLQRNDLGPSEFIQIKE